MASDAELGMSASAGTADTAPSADEAVSKSIMLPPDVFPDGMKPKAGDKLVLGEPGEDGMIPATLEAAPEQGKDSTGREEWESDFRKHMSPSIGGEEAQ